jgi:hypothetical protein
LFEKHFGILFFSIFKLEKRHLSISPRRSEKSSARTCLRASVICATHSPRPAQSAAPSRELADAFLADFESDDDDAQHGGDGADAGAADGADDSDSDSMDGDDGEKSGDGKKSAAADGGDDAADDEEDATPLTDKTFELVVRLLDDPRLPAHFAKLERLNAGAAAAGAAPPTREEEYPVIVASNQVLGVFVWDEGGAGGNARVCLVSLVSRRIASQHCRAPCSILAPAHI